MSSVLESLKNQIALYERYRGEGRKDLIASIVLKKLEKEIKALKEQLHDQGRKRQATIVPKSTGRIVGHVHKVVRGLTRYKDICYRAVLRVFKSNTLQAKGAVK